MIKKQESENLINNIFNIDQELRKNSSWSIKTSKRFDTITTYLLKEYVKIYGIPLPQDVGQKVADEFVVLLSHCNDLNFVESVLQKEEFIKASFNKENIAIAYDNLLVKRGKKQCYGSVLNIVENNDGSFRSVPLEIESPEDVDARRKAFGIRTTLDEYIKNAHRILEKIRR